MRIRAKTDSFSQDCLPNPESVISHEAKRMEGREVTLRYLVFVFVTSGIVTVASAWLAFLPVGGLITAAKSPSYLRFSIWNAVVVLCCATLTACATSALFADREVFGSAAITVHRWCIIGAIIGGVVARRQTMTTWHPGSIGIVRSERKRYESL